MVGRFLYFKIKQVIRRQEGFFCECYICLSHHFLFEMCNVGIVPWFLLIPAPFEDDFVEKWKEAAGVVFAGL